MYKSKAKALAAYKAYLAKNPGADEAEINENGLPEEFEEAFLECEKEDNLVRRMFLQRRKWPPGHVLPGRRYGKDG